jgi:hypothetical protein
VDGLKFSVTLEDQVSKSADHASASLNNLHTSLEGAHSGAAHASEGFFKVIEPTEAMRHAIESAGAGFKEFSNGLKSGEAKEAVSGLAEGMAGLVSTLDLVVPGLGQVASAAVKAGGAFAAMTVGVIQAGVEMALEVTAVNDKLTQTFQALGQQGPESGRKTVAFLDQLSSKLPQSREQLAQWTKQYEALGITDFGQLRQQLLATASAQAIMGDQGAAAYQKITERVNLAVEAHSGLKLAEKSLKALYGAGVNVTDIAGKMGVSVKQLEVGLKAGTVDAQAFGNALSETLVKKGKGPLEAMGDELGTLKTKGLETLGHLFDGVDTKPLLAAIKNVIGLGDLGTPTGKSLKGGITDGLNGIIELLAKTITRAEIIFLNLGAAALRTGITVKGAFQSAVIGVQILGEVAKTMSGPFVLAYEAAKALFGLLDSHAGIVAGGGKKIADSALSTLKGSNGGIEIGSTAPAHASGGLVGRPAPGEYFASVAPGEMILPARETRQMTGNALGGLSATMSANDNASLHGGGVEIQKLEVNITAPHGVTDAQSISVTGLTVALERLQLAVGR